MIPKKQREREACWFCRDVSADENRGGGDNGHWDRTDGWILPRFTPRRGYKYGSSLLTLWAVMTVSKSRLMHCRKGPTVWVLRKPVTGSDGLHRRLPKHGSPRPMTRLMQVRLHPFRNDTSRYHKEANLYITK